MYKLKIFFFILLPLLVFSQDKKDFYVGGELGLNRITSFNLNENKNSIQGGFLLEYFIFKKWSLNGRIKYYKTGVSFNKSNNDWTIFPGSTSSYGMNSFSGQVISLPITLNWYYKFILTTKGYLRIGLVANYETKSEYNFNNSQIKENKFYGNCVLGFGFQKQVANKLIVFTDFEIYRLGDHKASSESLVFSKNYYTNNNHLSFGLKYKL